MAEKKTEKKPFDPIARAVVDSFDVHFLGGRHFNLQKFGANSRKRGLYGKDVWTQKALSTPLKLFLQESKDSTEEQIDALLNEFAIAIGYDSILVKRHFYAIKQGWENQFLNDLDKQEEKRKKLEELVEEAEFETSEEEENGEEAEEEE